MVGSVRCVEGSVACLDSCVVVRLVVGGCPHGLDQADEGPGPFNEYDGSLCDEICADIDHEIEGDASDADDDDDEDEDADEGENQHDE